MNSKFKCILYKCYRYESLVKRSSYWGKAAAGILFICSEDSTMLLTLRSYSVKEPNTWGLPGGAVRFVEDDEESDLNGAKREVIEELGSLPSGMKKITETIFTDKDFTYTTFVFDIPLEEKNKWTPTIYLNWENNDAKWFRKNELPSNLHFGIRSLAKLLKDQGNEIFEIPVEDKDL